MLTYDKISIMSTGWLFFSFITLILWGFWGFFSKVATSYSDPKSVYLYGSIGAMVVTLSAIFFFGFRFDLNPKGILYSILAGLLGGAGVIFFYFAMKSGKSAIVVTLTALYPLITFLLSYFLLHEQITLKQLSGIILAIIAIILLST